LNSVAWAGYGHFAMTQYSAAGIVNYFLTAVAVATVATGAAGCGRATGPSDKGKPATSVAGRLYRVRGEIYQLPDPQIPGASLMIRHEAIPDFVNQQGEKVGMAAMTMAFEPAPGLSWPDLQVGDKVEFDLQVDWERGWYGIVALRKLPPETPLKFGSGSHGH
jgi:hypothetical protein